MKNEADNKMAFPVVLNEYIQFGMTLRDYFAAKAMQALLPNGNHTVDVYARDSYKMADAIIKAREE